MLIFLYGEDTYRSRQKLQEIIARYKKIHKSGLNLRYLDGGKLAFQDFQRELQTCSMFKEKKLIIIKDVFSNSEFKEKFPKFAKKFQDSKNIIVFYENKDLPRNDSLFKFLKKEAKSQEFKPLETEKLKNWARKEFKGHGKEIDPRVLNQLIYYIGSDLWRFSNEIKKIISYELKSGDGKISGSDLDLLIKPNIETGIFRTIDAIALKDKKKALYLLHKHLEKGDSPLYLLSMINFQFRNLLMLKSCQTPRELGMHPFTIKKTTQQIRKFTLNELKKIYRKIFQADLDIKTGRVDAETALDLLIAEI